MSSPVGNSSSSSSQSSAKPYEMTPIQVIAKGTLVGQKINSRRSLQKVYRRIQREFSLPGAVNTEEGKTRHVRGMVFMGTPSSKP